MLFAEKILGLRLTNQERAILRGASSQTEADSRVAARLKLRLAKKIEQAMKRERVPIYRVRSWHPAYILAGTLKLIERFLSRISRWASRFAVSMKHEPLKRTPKRTKP